MVLKLKCDVVYKKLQAGHSSEKEWLGPKFNSCWQLTFSILCIGRLQNIYDVFFGHDKDENDGFHCNYGWFSFN